MSTKFPNTNYIIILDYIVTNYTICSNSALISISRVFEILLLSLDKQFSIKYIFSRIFKTAHCRYGELDTYQYLDWPWCTNPFSTR